MFICICNALTDRQAKIAIEAGACTWADIHAHYGCVPNCGQCELELSDLIKKNNSLLTNDS